ncbi:hypothetical protein C6P45_004326 [Maudiozyma exigua]|uniref:Zn(2)-C6 fungal-type domain-containing protein n=1 Tax=Maudiozyma exigua TaxID=34358 RepID=A0A9P6WAS2_MAUEX|nr:hypothetical protein C6P45_004326 [Kazachstania exigua]
MGRPKKEVSEEKIERFQRELELAGERTDILLQDKKGRSRSCLLCRRRKQRCDHKVPSCTACLKAGVKCVQPVRYINALNNNTSNHRTKNVKQQENVEIVSNSNDEITRDSIQNIHNDKIPSQEKKLKIEKKINKKKKDSDKIMDITSPSKDDYTKLLEKKLKYLEKLVSLETNSAEFNKKLQQYKKISHLLEKADSIESENLITLPAPHPDNSPVNLRSGTPNTAGSPANSSGLAPFIKVSTSYFQRQNGNVRQGTPIQSTQQQIDQNNTRPIHVNRNSSIRPDTSSATASMIQQTNPNGNQNTNANIPLLSSDSVDSIDFSKCIFAKYNLKEFYSYDPAFEFDEELSRSFLDTFFTRLQFKYPLLDEQEIYEFHENYIKNSIYSYSDNEFHFSCGRMWLVYTIAACLHMTTGKYKGQPPVRYFSTAIRHITRCGEKLNYGQRIELLTLLVLYLLRTDRDTMILYDIISDVMKICKDDLHLNKWDDQDPIANKKLRLFWCVYLLERMICVSVGKPYTVTESEIDLPFFSEDSFNTKNTKIHRGVHFINQSLKLRRIESNFVEKLKILPNNGRPQNNNKKELRKQLPQLKKIFHDLEVWRSNCVQTYVKNFENETLKLYYYRSVRLLIQPYLEALTPEDRLFREYQAAAGQICQLYKIFHQKTITGHSTPAVHTIFVAGVTLIYCMWLARNYDDERRKNLGDISKHTRPLVTASLFSTMDDLRACSVCLYVMTERSDFARMFRDTFDQLMNATVGNLIERCGPNSAELIYMSSTGDQSSSDVGSNNGTSPIDSEKSSQTNSNGIDDNIIGNNARDGRYEEPRKNSGMPPAMNRTFGKRQAEEHVGFVENSQVDIDEQKKMKQRRGMLEKISVPKSLSHLLTNNDSDIRSEDKNNGTAIETTRSNTYQSSSASSMEKGLSESNELHRTIEGDAGTQMNPTTERGTTKNNNHGDKKKQYIVKKPINIVEFNWKNFEHQAFLQQHFAQQNLQAYLTAQSHWSNNGSVNEMGANFNTAKMMNSGQYQLDESNIYPQPTNGSIVSQQQNNGNNQIINTYNQGPTTRGMNELIAASETVLNANNNNSNNNNTANNMMYAMSLNNDSTPLPNNNGNNNNNTINTAVTFSSGPSINISIPEKNPNPSDILFNNGTHDMINNISTWTTNSINEVTGQMSLANNNGMRPDQGMTQQESNMGMNNYQDSSVNKNNGRNYNQYSNVPQVLSNGGNGNNKDGSRGENRPAEEFWRVNDDYGFLT